jgi:hypothetical protein
VSVAAAAGSFTKKRKGLLHECCTAYEVSIDLFYVKTFPSRLLEGICLEERYGSTHSLPRH